MIKSLLFVVDLLVSTLLAFFFASSIEITHNFPEYIEPNTSETVTFTIDKESISGFAKLELSIPDDISVQQVDVANATFTFRNGKAKLIWISLPEEPSFQVSLKFLASKKAEGTKIIEGDFLYVEENERKKYQLNNIYFSAAAKPLVEVVPEEPNEPEPSTQPELTEVTEPEVGETQILSDSIPNEPIVKEVIEQEIPEPAEVKINRAVQQQGDEFIIELSIAKESLNNFGKAEEIIPEGFQAQALLTDGAVFSFTNQQAKFTWTQLPEKESLKISYKLLPQSVQPGTFIIQGDFAYFENDEAKNILINPSTITVEPKPEPVAEVVKEEPKEEPKPKTAEPKKPEPKKEEDKPIPKTKAASKAPVAQPKENLVAADAPIFETGVSNREGLTFRVQIEAGNKLVSTQYFERLYEYKGRVNLETHQGWLKYTVGYFNTFREANIARKSIDLAYNFPGPFVTAYYQGERISLQEALMISRKKAA
jgi:hypothetical protein